MVRDWGSTFSGDMQSSSSVDLQRLQEENFRLKQQLNSMKNDGTLKGCDKFNDLMNEVAQLRSAVTKVGKLRSIRPSNIKLDFIHLM